MVHNEASEEKEDTPKKSSLTKDSDVKIEGLSRNGSNENKTQEGEGEWYEQGWYKELQEADNEIIFTPQHTPALIRYKAYQRMLGYAIRYSNDKLPRKKWNEVYGILIGAVEENVRVVVKDAIPLCVGGLTGVELEPMHYVDVSQINTSIWQKSVENKETDFIVGWWHTHPGMGFFFSPVDCYTHLGYQLPNPYAVGLIFDHTQKKEDHLGVAALRLYDTTDAFLNRFITVELEYEEDVKTINKKIDKISNDINKNMGKALKELKEIENLRKKQFFQLQKDYGLILIPKTDDKVLEAEGSIEVDAEEISGEELEEWTEEDLNELPKDELEEDIEEDIEENAEEDEDKVYIWDPEFFQKTYTIPEFRAQIEDEILKGGNTLLNSKNVCTAEQYQELKEKISTKIRKLLEKPNQFHNELLNSFQQKIKIITPYYDYLDTEERMIIEYFEERLAQYDEILSDLNNRAEFKDL